MATPPKPTKTRHASSVGPSKIRKRCENCGELFPRTRKDRRFCKDECRKEFNRFGAAYGPLKQKIYKEISQKFSAVQKDIKLHLEILGLRLQEIEGRLHNFKTRIDYPYVVDDYGYIKETDSKVRIVDVERIQAAARSKAG